MPISQHVVAQISPLVGGHAITQLGPDLYKTQVAEPIMSWVDSLPQEWRLLVHEHGTHFVRKAMAARAKPKAVKIERLVHELELNL